MNPRLILDNTYFELEQVCLHSSASIAIPNGFKEMDTLTRKVKYPHLSNETLVFSDKTANCNLLFNFVDYAIPLEEQFEFVNENQSIVLFQLAAATVVDSAKAYPHKIPHTSINYFTYLNRCMDTDSFNVVYYIFLRKRTLIANFNCPNYKAESYGKLFYEIIKTLEVKEEF